LDRKWAVRLGQVFKNSYGQKFTSAFKDEGEIEGWVTTWMQLECDLDSMQAAIKALPSQFPEWPPTLGQFKALLGNQSKPYVSLPPPPKTQPNAEQAAILQKVATAAANPRMPWWTPDKVRNQKQVDFIVMQARHFGEASDAGQFLKKCQQVGVVTQNNLLGEI
jgi:hypothetical protein